MNEQIKELESLFGNNKVWTLSLCERQREIVLDAIEALLETTMDSLNDNPYGDDAVQFSADLNHISDIISKLKE